MRKSFKNLSRILQQVSRSGGLSANEAAVCAALAMGGRGRTRLSAATGLDETAVGTAMRGLKGKGVIAYVVRRGAACYSEVTFIC